MLNVPPWLSRLWLKQTDGAVVATTEKGEDGSCDLRLTVQDDTKPTTFSTEFVRNAKGTYYLLFAPEYLCPQ